MMHDADDRIERLIDRAASALTDAETSAAFTARVLAALDAPAARRGSWWGPAPAFATACAMLVIAIAAWWPGTDAPSHRPADAHILASRSLPTTAVLVPAVSALAVASRALAATGVGVAPRVEFPRVQAYDPIDIVDLAIAPLATESAPLVVEPLLAPDPIPFEPVAIDAIERLPSPRSDPPQLPGGRR